MLAAALLFVVASVYFVHWSTRRKLLSAWCLVLILAALAEGR